jgi:hypothetical protein
VSSQPLMSKGIRFNSRVSKGRLSNRLMIDPKLVVRAITFALFLSLLSVASIPLAYGQTFGLSIPLGLNRPAVDPGGSAIATIDLTSSAGFNSPVSLSCDITSGPVTTSAPVCTVSPETQVPPANGPSLTITTSNTTSEGLYNFTVTGTSGSITQTVALNLTVQPLSEDYTLSVSPTIAVPNPVTAGSGATTTVTVSPIGSYSGHVTLACLSISPADLLAPVCSFNPPTVTVTGGLPPTSVLTLTTTGPAPTTRLRTRQVFYAFCLAAPGLGLIALSTNGGRRKNILGMLLLMLLAGGVLLMPAGGSSGTSGGNVTPNKTYVFTLTGADENGAGPSNTSTNPATVSITVN